MVRIFNTLFLLLLMLAFFVSPTHAEVERRSEVAKQKMQERAEKRDAACERLEKRIQNKETNFDNTHKLHVRQYQRIKEKLANVIRDAKTAGKDASKLEANLALLNTKIDTFDTDRLALIDALKEVRALACAEDKDAFKEALEEAQAQQKKVLADVRDIKRFYQTVIRANLRALNN